MKRAKRPKSDTLVVYVDDSNGNHRRIEFSGEQRVYVENKIEELDRMHQLLRNMLHKVQDLRVLLALAEQEKAK